MAMRPSSSKNYMTPGPGLGGTKKENKCNTTGAIPKMRALTGTRTSAVRAKMATNGATPASIKAHRAGHGCIDMRMCK